MYVWRLCFLCVFFVLSCIALAPPPSPLPLLFVGEVVALDGWGRAIFFVFFFLFFWRSRLHVFITGKGCCPD